jgi:RNA polymerase sigma factor (sigma-70 family)
MEAASAIRGLPAQLRARSFERECEQLRPLGVAYVLRRFSGSLNEADAEDAVADVLIRLHRRMVDGRAPDNLRAAFFTSVRNAAIDQLRARSVRPTVALEAAADAPAEAPAPAERAESRDDAMRLQEAMGRMRGNYREAILLRFGLGLTVPEIAEHLQISLPAAKKLVLRATAQVKKRLEAIEGAEFCPEMREHAQRSLFEKEASGLASESEAEVLRAHFAHCGSCRSFLFALHGTLHDLGASAVLGLAVVAPAARQVGLLDRASGWASAAGDAVQGGVGRLRHLAYRAAGAFPGSDGAPSSALMGTGQKIAAVCTAGAATTATCLATGIVGPGIGLTPTPVVHAHPRPPAHVKEQASAPSSAAPASVVAATSSAVSTVERESTPASHPADSKPVSDASKSKAQQAKSPAQQSESQFGFEGSSPSTTPSSTSSTSSAASASSAAPAAESAPAPEPAPSPPPESSSSSGGGGSSSGSESFGFGG